jgi:hypothetical protein
VWKLYDLNKRRSISVNHSVMEILVASHLLKKGFDNVDVESNINGVVADVIAYKNDKKTIVEIETGFTPAEHSIDPVDYLKARIASKIARYSIHSDHFILAYPVYYIPPIPPTLLKDPLERDVDELIRLRELINSYYSNPPIEILDLARARVDVIYILNVDRYKIYSIHPSDLLSFYRYGARSKDIEEMLWEYLTSSPP